MGLEFEGFANDEKTTYAVIRALEIIGEAAKKIPKVIRSLPPIPYATTTAGYTSCR